MVDPIVEEVRAVRYALFAKHGNNLQTWSDSIQKSGICRGHEIVPTPSGPVIEPNAMKTPTVIPQHEPTTVRS